MVFWRPHYSATVTVGVPNLSALTQLQTLYYMKNTISLFGFTHRANLSPRIKHVHGELGGNLGIRLNFLTLVGTVHKSV